MELKETVEMMNSDNYKERFKAEYHQTKTRYERLKSFNTKIEAARRARSIDYHVVNLPEIKIEEPKHDCPFDLLIEQQDIMGQYLHVLELRAEIEHITL